MRAYMMKELLVIYGVSRNTFKRWIQPLNLGTRQGYYYTRNQVEIIFRHYPPPHEVIIDYTDRYAGLV
jgi:hypothetical protein